MPRMIAPPYAPLSGEILDAIRGVASLPALALDRTTLPLGGGRRVLVVPGYLTNDLATAPLRLFLRSLGYRVEGWGQGINRGEVGRGAQRVAARVATLPAPVTLIGWSLGGIIAREAARQVPDRVDQVITLGSPVVGGPVATRFAARYERQGADLAAIAARIAERNTAPLPVPVTAFYSRRDAIVAWPACLDPNPDNPFTAVEVEAGHYALCLSRAMLVRIAITLGEGPSSRSA